MMTVWTCRYKYVVTASIGSMPAEPSASVLVSSQCLWNSVTDRYSKVSFMDDHGQLVCWCPVSVCGTLRLIVTQRSATWMTMVS